MFDYRTFRFNQIRGIQQEHTIDCKLKIQDVPFNPDAIKDCTCYYEDECKNGIWEAWTECDGSCFQSRIRRRDENEEMEERDCRSESLKEAQVGRKPCRT